MGDLPKLAWSRDVTGKVDNIHSNLFQKSQAIKNEKKKNTAAQSKTSIGKLMILPTQIL